MQTYIREISRYNISTKNVKEMLERVKQWEPPTSDHAPLKEFMLRQLEETRTYLRIPTAPEPFNPTEWHRQRLASARDLITFYEECLASSKPQTDKALIWIQDLHKSVPNEIIKSKNGTSSAEGPSIGQNT